MVVVESLRMKKTGAKTESKIKSREDGFKDWEARYAAKVRAYERMAEKREDKRRAKEGERRAQARRDRELAVQDAYDRKYIENSDPFVGLPYCATIRRNEEILAAAYGLLCRGLMSAGSALCACVFARLTRWAGTRLINRIETLVMRQSRYELERKHRSSAERERRRIRRRSTVNPKPKPDDVRKAWLVANESWQGIVRFGAVIHDLECYVNNRLEFSEDGIICGRHEGLKGWLERYAIELAPRYKTIMRYKSIAKRCRQYLGLQDPQALDADNPRLVELLGDCPAEQKELIKRLDEKLNID